MYLLSRVMVWSIGVESWSGFLECVLEWNKVRFSFFCGHLFKNVNRGNPESFCSIILIADK